MIYFFIGNGGAEKVPLFFFTGRIFAVKPMKSGVEKGTSK